MKAQRNRYSADFKAKLALEVIQGNRTLTEIASEAEVLENTVIGNNCAVEEDATVKDSILWDGSTVMRHTHLERCVVGRDCKVKTDAAIFDGIIVNPQRPENPVVK